MSILYTLHSLQDYLAIMADYHADRFETYCEFCEECMYDGYQQWVQYSQQNAQNYYNNRDLKEGETNSLAITEDWKADMEERQLGDMSQFLINKGYKICPEYETCKYYQNLCKAGIEDTLEEYFECTEVERNNGQAAYIGPHCGEDGRTVTLGIYSDENCNEYIGKGVNIANFLGFELDQDALEGYVTGSLARDIIPEDYMEQYWNEELMEYYNPQEQLCIPCSTNKQLYEQRGNMYNMYTYEYYQNNQQNYNDEVNELCENMYMASARCDKHYRYYSSKTKYAKYAAATSVMDLNCDFIDSVVMGNYDEMGFINLNNTDYNPAAKSGFLSSNMYVEEYGHYVTEVSPLQIFGLCASLLACAILGLWSYALNHSIRNGKVSWRPRKGTQSNSLAAADLSRQDSGIVMGRSASNMERAKSNASYYMS